MIQVPVQITARGFKLADWWKDALRQKVEKLEEFHHRITACHVVVEAVTHHHRKGRVYKVRVDVEVPRGLVVIDREPAPTLEEAIELAFDAAGRKLEDLSRRLRGDVKHHEGPPEGTVAEVFPESGYGFILTEEGREVYFHRNSVLGGLFDRLTPGTRVRFAEEKGEKGPQASSVTVAKVAPRPERRRRLSRTAAARR